MGGTRVSEQTRQTEAVKAAESREFEQGVDFGLLEFIQYRTTPSLGSGSGRRMLLGALKAVALFAPVLGLLLPVGGMQFQLNIDTPGVRGSELAGLATVCFWVAAAGQLWNLIDWWRTGRHLETRAFWSSAVGLVTAGIALWWFPSLMPPFAFTAVAVPIVLTVAIAAVAVVLQLSMRRPGTRIEAERRARAERLRALPDAEHARLRAERGEILEALLARGLVDRDLADRAAGVPLGEWWTLDRGTEAQR